MERRQSRAVFAGGVQIGGDAPVSVQSMLNVPAHDVEGNVAQAKSLYEAGCEIIRAAVPDLKSAQLIPALKKAVPVPVVADIHFDYRIALACVEAGVDKIRINPGNIGSDERVKAVADACRAQSIPIRIGVNSGSLEKEILAKHGAPTAQALAESAMYHVRLLEKCDFCDIVISIKSSDVQRMVEAYEIIAAQCDYPLHLGVTEAGTARMGLIKSSAGIGSLLLHGIGDTIRVSLTGDPLEEIKSAKLILKTLGLRQGGVEVVSCPTCGRTQINLIQLANQVENMVADIPLDIKVAVMGCIVNGPGEAKEADIGIAGGIGEGLIIKHGEVFKKVPESELLEALRYELLHWNE